MKSSLVLASFLCIISGTLGAEAAATIEPIATTADGTSSVTTIIIIRPSGEPHTATTSDISGIIPPPFSSIPSSAGSITTSSGTLSSVSATTSTSVASTTITSGTIITFSTTTVISTPVTSTSLSLTAPASSNTSSTSGTSSRSSVTSSTGTSTSASGTTTGSSAMISKKIDIGALATIAAILSGSLVGALVLF